VEFVYCTGPPPEYFGSSPYSKCAEVGNPSGLTDPENAALLLLSTEGGPVFTEVGGPGFIYVNWSAGLVVLVPPGPVTVTSTVPGDPGGDTAVICESLLTVNELAGVEPKFTPVAPVKFDPLTVTEVPPVTGPAEGLTPVTVNAQSPKLPVNWLLGVPSGDCTSSVWVPGDSAAVSMRWEDSTLDATGEPSTNSCEPWMKFEPLITATEGCPPVQEFAALEIAGVPASAGLSTETSSISQPRYPLNSESFVENVNRTSTPLDPAAGVRSTRYSCQDGETSSPLFE
jgi:hypothetical protein